ncbi:MAG: alpha-amylase family protein [Clostridiaceae bacterium]|nr:alpha-amylase family protein [Clostridiaceae bacterium]
MANRPMRIGAIQYGQKPEDTMKVPAVLEQGGFNVEQLLHAVGKAGYGLYQKSIHEQLLKEYLADSHARGIDVILYTNVHMVDQHVAKEHPDWLRRDEQGDQEMVNGDYVMICINSPWREAFLSSVKDSLEQDIQGIFLDGPVFRYGGCRCAACRSLFAAQFGRPIETAGSAELRQFNSRHLARFLKDTRDLITARHKPVILYMNNEALFGTQVGCQIDTVYPYVDWIGAEGGFVFYGNPNEVSLWKTTVCTKYLEAKSGGKPYVVFNAGNHQPWARYMLTSGEVGLAYGSAIANGGNVWFGIHGLIDNFNSDAGRTAFRFNRFVAEHEEYFTDTRQYADIALMWSYRTYLQFADQIEESDFTKSRQLTGGRGLGSFQKEFHGFADMLLRSHRQFAILDETNIGRGDLQNYQLLILPNVMCVDDDTEQKIRDFVEAGGHLVMTLAGGLFDENGQVRRQPAFRDLCGMKDLVEVIDYVPGCGYLTPERGGHDGWEAPETPEAPEAPEAGFSTPVVNGQYEPDAEVLASAYKPMEGRYSTFNEEKYSCVVLHRRGKGQTAYIAGGIGQSYADFGLLSMKRIVDGLTDLLTDSEIKIEQAFPSLEIELRTQAALGRRLIHLVNHTGYMQRPVSGLIPCRGIRITMKAAYPIKSVRALAANRDIPYTRHKDEIQFEVDVEDYELIVIDKTSGGDAR